jgi:hypothetical protein
MQAKSNQDIKNTVTFWMTPDAVLDCILDSLTTYTFTTGEYTLQITNTHRLVYSVCYSLH